MSTNKRQLTFFSPLGLIVTAVAFFYLFDFSIDLLPKNAKVIAPWAAGGFYFASVAYIVTVMSKFYEMRSLNGLSKREKRRIHVQVSRKVRLASFAISYNAISFVIFIGFLAFLSSDEVLFKKAFPIIGGLLGISFFIHAFFMYEAHNISIFKSDIENREAEKAQIAKRLKAIKESEKDD